ncbi:Hypothetical protein BFF96_2147 [Corynebacterium pseudotuberculosis]|nr:Hypothetical protein BFF96_2147 [Corynebacterium pseudotuberculosis]
MCALSAKARSSRPLLIDVNQPHVTTTLPRPAGRVHSPILGNS